jgi:hypothetical protein
MHHAGYNANLAEGMQFTEAARISSLSNQLLACRVTERLVVGQRGKSAHIHDKISLLWMREMLTVRDR